MNKNQQSYFDCHPHVNEFFFTSDGMAFFNKSDAEAHAGYLANKDIEHIKRSTRQEVFTQQEQSGDVEEPKPTKQKTSKK